MNDVVNFSSFEKSICIKVLLKKKEKIPAQQYETFSHVHILTH